MKNTYSFGAKVLFGVLVLSSLVMYGAASQTQASPDTLSESEKEGLLLMREEEKLARDVYLELYDTWGIQIFSNIAQSEQTHTDAVKNLLDTYSIADPMTIDTRGVFEKQELQTLYDELVAQGKISLVSALQVGATVEDLDIFDLQNLQKDVDNADILKVYANLERGSRNHLRSFNKQLVQNNGSGYTAQYLSQSEIDTIVSSEQERGNSSSSEGKNQQSKGSGNGNRGGNGNGKNQAQNQGNNVENTQNNNEEKAKNKNMQNNTTEVKQENTEKKGWFSSFWNWIW